MTLFLAGAKRISFAEAGAKKMSDSDSERDVFALVRPASTR